MSTGWTVVVALGAGTYLLKAAGPLLVGGRRLPPLVERLANGAPAALLAALVATSVASEASRLVLDARFVGLTVAAAALWRRLPFVMVVLLAAVGTAAVRALT